MTDPHAHCKHHHGHGHPLAAPTSEPPTEDTLWTCPMHPEVVSRQSGHCPKCGMALEPKLPTLEAMDENPELKDFRRRFWWTLPLSVVVTVVAMSGHLFNGQAWFELTLAAPVVLWGGAPFFARGWQSLVHRSPNMWTLIALGIGAAFVYSVVATVAPDGFPSTFASMGRIGVYYEAAAVIVSLTLLGQMLELRARAQTSAAIKSLLGLSPKTARRLNADGTEDEIPLTHVHVGDRLRQPVTIGACRSFAGSACCCWSCRCSARLRAHRLRGRLFSSLATRSRRAMVSPRAKAGSTSWPHDSRKPVIASASSMHRSPAIRPPVGAPVCPHCCASTGHRL